MTTITNNDDDAAEDERIYEENERYGELLKANLHVEDLTGNKEKSTLIIYNKTFVM